MQFSHPSLALRFPSSCSLPRSRETPLRCNGRSTPQLRLASLEGSPPYTLRSAAASPSVQFCTPVAQEETSYSTWLHCILTAKCGCGLYGISFMEMPSTRKMTCTNRVRIISCMISCPVGTLQLQGFILSCDSGFLVLYIQTWFNTAKLSLGAVL